MSELIQLESLPVETLAEMANEAAAACEASGRKTVEHAIRCGRALLAAKEQVKHGEWGEWLQQHFDQTQMRATQYMAIAKLNTCLNLDDATSISGALRLIAESPEKQARKAEREAKKLETQPKSLAPAAPAPPVSSGTIRNESLPTPAPPSAPGAMATPSALDLTRQRLVLAQRMANAQMPAWLADPDELERLEKDELQPLPKTNTHHTAANRRTPDARETDRIGIVPPDDPRSYHDGHWYEWSEDRGRMVAVTDEEILRRADQIRGRSVVEHAGTTTPVVEHKADSVSNKPGKVPTLSQLLLAVEGKTDWTHALRESARDWAAYKMTLAGKDKIRSMESWQKALTRMGNVAKDRDVATVCEAIEKAIANGWTGWEHLETGGSRGGSRISTAVRSNRNWDEEIPEWKPTE